MTERLSWPVANAVGTPTETFLRHDGVRQNVAARLTTAVEAAAAAACADRLPRLATEKPRDRGECTQDRALGPLKGVGVRDERNRDEGGERERWGLGRDAPATCSERRLCARNEE